MQQQNLTTRCTRLCFHSFATLLSATVRRQRPVTMSVLADHKTRLPTDRVRKGVCYGCRDLLNVRCRLTNELYSRAKEEEKRVSDPIVEVLILDLLQWLTNGDRTYEEVMDAWRTSCPRLPVWEDAKDRGLIASEHVNGREVIRASSLGFALLDRCGLGQRSEVSRTT